MQCLGISQSMVLNNQPSPAGLIDLGRLEPGNYAQLVPSVGGGRLEQVQASFQTAYVSSGSRGSPQYLSDELLLSTTADNQELGGERQVCTFYLRTGTCAYGDRCKFLHPKDRPPPSLNSRGYPFRQGEPDCAHYIKKGWCAFGLTCKFNHPEASSPKVQYSVQQGSYLPMQGLAAGGLLAVPQQYYYAYPSQSAPPGQLPLAVAPGLAQPAPVTTVQAALPAMQQMSTTGRIMYAAVHTPAMGHVLQAASAMQGTQAGIEQLSSGFGQLRLQQAGQLMLDRR